MLRHNTQTVLLTALNLFRLTPKSKTNKKSLSFVLLLACCPGSHVRHNDASSSANKRRRKINWVPFSYAQCTVPRKRPFNGEVVNCKCHQGSGMTFPLHGLLWRKFINTPNQWTVGNWEWAGSSPPTPPLLHTQVLPSNQRTTKSVTWVWWMTTLKWMIFWVQLARKYFVVVVVHKRKGHRRLTRYLVDVLSGHFV